MSFFDLEHNPENLPDNQVFIDLTDQITYVFDDAFDRMLENGRGLAEFVYIDSYSIYDQELYGILLSENGGKVESGAEQINILAYKNGNFENIQDAAKSMLIDGNGLAYKSDQYFIAHKSRSGESKFIKVDDNGIYPWLPHLNDLLFKDITCVDELIIDQGQIQFEGENNEPDITQSAETKMQKKQLRQLDVEYAKELIDKLENWFFIPNN